MKAVLRMIGVASLIGSAACLPSFDQPAAQNTVQNPETPVTSPNQATGDNSVVSPLTPVQQTAIWMQGGDPSLLADRAYNEGPIGIASQRHSCAKIKFNTLGRFLAGRGVAITAGDNPATLPVTATTTCPTPVAGAVTQSTSHVYCTSQLTLGIPQYTARLSESTSVTSGTATKIVDLYATAATEIEQKLVGNAFPAAATACVDKTGTQAVMFNANNTCNEAGVTCLQGYPATTEQVALCSRIVTQAQAAGAIPAVTAGRRLAIATILAGTNLCE